MSAGPFRLTVTGSSELAVELDAPGPGAPAAAPGVRVARLGPTGADVARGVRRFEIVVDGWLFEVVAEPAVRAALRERATRAAAEHHAAVGMTLRAQIPGRIVRLWVTEGQEVDQGERLLAVEAMKMENEIRAPHAGRVGELRVELGKLVERGDELLTIS
jgi:biotin carboxyl carrier protein